MNQTLETLEPTDRAAKRVIMGDNVIYKSRVDSYCPAKVQQVGTDGYCRLCVFFSTGPSMVSGWVEQGDGLGQWDWPPPRP